MPDPAPVPNPSDTNYQIPKSWMPLLSIAMTVLLAVAMAKGWLTPEQATTIKALVPLSAQQEDNKAEQSFAVVKQPELRALSPEQVQQILDIITQLKPVIAEWVKPKVDPAPVIVTPPGPVPQPLPSQSAIIITNELGAVLTSPSVDPGALVRVSYPSTDIDWSISQGGESHKITLPNKAGFVCSLQPGAYLEFHVADYAAKKQFSARINCNQGPQPPPVVTPVVNVDPIDKSDLRVVIVYESKPDAPYTKDQLTALNSTKLVAALDAACVRETDGTTGWHRWDKDLDAGKSPQPWPSLWGAVKPKAIEAGLPIIAICRGSKVAIHPITNEADALALVQGAKNGI